MASLMSSSTRLVASPKVLAGGGQGTGWLGLKDMLRSPAPAKPDGIPFPASYDFFLSPITPVVFGLLYFATAKTLSHYSDGKNRLNGPIAKSAIIIHNFFLFAYSAWTFARTAPAFAGAFARAYWEDGLNGLVHAFCDSSFTVWSATEFPFFCYTFYLSKFYEIIDTAIILLKGKKVGLLQSYHHTGAIWTMFAGFRTMSMPIWIFVVFNSGIHSLMYMYYTFSALRWPFPQVLKKSLTKLQITQFLVGGSLAASYLFITLPSSSFPSIPPSFSSLMRLSTIENTLVEHARLGGQCLVDRGQRLAVWINLFYLAPLTVLFARFFIKSYRRGASATVAAKQAKTVAAKSA